MWFYIGYNKAASPTEEARGNYFSECMNVVLFPFKFEYSVVWPVCVCHRPKEEGKGRGTST